MYSSTTNSQSSLDSVKGAEITFICITSTSIFYKIKLPSVYNGHYIKFSGMSGRVSIYALYKND